MKRQTLGELIDSGIISIATGFPCGSHNDFGEGVPHIRPFNVCTDGTVSLTQKKFIAHEATQGKPTLCAGDILFNNTNSKELVGKCAVWDIEEEYAFSNHMTKIHVNNQEVCNSYYLSYSILYHWMIGASMQLSRSHVAQASIIGERFREIEIPRVCPQEQKKIALTLKTIQDALSINERELARWSSIKHATMHKLFTCGLRGEPQKETEIGLVPERWEILPLHEVAFVQTGVAKGRKLRYEELIEVPYLRVANVQDGRLDLSEIKTIRIRYTEFDRYLLQEGDVLLTEGGDFDKLGRGVIWRGEIADCIHQNHVFAIRVDRDKLLPEFLAYLAQSPYGKAYFLKVAHKTTNLACINTTKLKAFPVAFPVSTEQQEIVDILDAIDQKIDLHRRKKAVLEELFKSLLHKLMTGEIRVDDLDLSALEDMQPQPKEVPHDPVIHW